MTPRSSLVLLILSVATAGSLAQAAGKRPVGIDDLYRLETARSVVLAPDGRRAIYLRQWIDPKSREERQALWLTEGTPGSGRALEQGEPDGRFPVWSPDGKWIAFVSTRARPRGWEQTPPVPLESDPAADVWLIRAEGGRAIPLAGREKPYGRVFHDGFYGRVTFSPDSRRLAFVADDGIDPRTPEEQDADVEVVRPDQGEGYTGYTAAQVWIAELEARPGKSAANSVRRLTKDDVWYGDPQWAPDGKSLVVHANRTDDRESVRFSINKNFDLWSLDAETGAIRQLTTGPGPEVSPRFSPDGRRMACLSIPRKGSHRDAANLAVVDLSGAAPQMRVLYDHHRQSETNPPHPVPSFPLPDECWDGPDRLLYSSALGTTTATVTLSVTRARGDTLPAGPPAYASEPSPVMQRFQRRLRLTPPANPFLAERELGPSRVINWKSPDGLEIEGILTLPPTGVGKAPYPLVVYPHGGPHSRSIQGFDWTVQVFAGSGYAVFQPNFRGSEGYGQRFIEADRFDLGGRDMEDILSGADVLIRDGIADPKRQFVYGVSYGGFTTCWLVGHTDRFRAAVAQNAVTDMNAMWGLSDLQSWTQWELGGLPWEVPEKMRAHSPITYADRVRTPTLILSSRDDRRCPLPMGRMFYQSLLARKVPTQQVIYPNEGHGIKQPRHREDVLRRVLAWFRQHDTQ